MRGRLPRTADGPPVGPVAENRVGETNRDPCLYPETVPGDPISGAGTVVVATPDGTNRYRNAVRAVGNTDTGTVAESLLTARDNAVYAIDDASVDVTADESFSVLTVCGPR